MIKAAMIILCHLRLNFSFPDTALMWKGGVTQRSAFAPTRYIRLGVKYKQISSLCQCCTIYPGLFIVNFVNTQAHYFYKSIDYLRVIYYNYKA